MQIAGWIQTSYAHGQEGELRAVATVIEQPGSGKFAIVACDVLFVTREMIDRVAAIIEKSCGIEPAHLLVNATHTHHAASTVRIHGCHAEPEFVRSVEAGIVQAVEAGQRPFDRRLPVSLPFGRGTEHRPEQPLASARRHDQLGRRRACPLVRPTGPFDPQLPVWSFRGPDDKLVGVIYNHSTHTIGSLRPGVRSPSFYGLAAQALGEKWGVPVCFLEGASGSTHNLNCSVADAIEKLKRDVTEGVEQAKPREVKRIVAIKRPFRFKVRTFDEQVEDKKVIDYCTKHAPGSSICVRESFGKRGWSSNPSKAKSAKRSASHPDRRRGPGRRAGRVLHRPGHGDQTAVAVQRHLRGRVGERLDRLLARPRGAPAGRISNLDGFAQLCRSRNRRTRGRPGRVDARRNGGTNYGEVNVLRIVNHGRSHAGCGHRVAPNLRGFGELGRWQARCSETA